MDPKARSLFLPSPLALHTFPGITKREPPFYYFGVVEETNNKTVTNSPGSDFKLWKSTSGVSSFFPPPFLPVLSFVSGHVRSAHGRTILIDTSLHTPRGWLDPSNQQRAFRSVIRLQDRSSETFCSLLLTCFYESTMVLFQRGRHGVGPKKI